MIFINAHFICNSPLYTQIKQKSLVDKTLADCLSTAKALYCQRFVLYDKFITYPAIASGNVLKLYPRH